jgi:seryl-tRNA synthetase
MLDIKFVREHTPEVKKMLKLRGKEIDLSPILQLDEDRRILLKKTEELRTERNKISSLKPSPETIEQGKRVKEEIKTVELQLDGVGKQLEEKLSWLPNMIGPDVPEGRDESDNQEIRRWGEPKKFDFEPLDHLEIGKRLDLLDLETAAEIAGPRMGILKNEAVLMQFGLVELVLKFLIGQGFQPVIPPALVKEKVMWGAGYFPGSRAGHYKLEGEELYLAGTAEHPLSAMHAEETIAEEKLPLKYAGYSTSFRTEAGSYGRDVRGIIRVHQFDKIEQFIFTKPQDSYSQLEKTVENNEWLLRKLEIPYRVVALCSGDLGTVAAKTYDVEAWIPSQKTYRELMSASNATDYQARRFNTRYKTKEGKTELVHTVNDTASAIGRTLVAILENYQQKDGSVGVPEILQHYVGKKVIVPK